MEFVEIFMRDAADTVDTCETTNDFNGRTNLRVLSIFMILISSGLGAFFPLLASKYSFIRLPEWCFFIAKFFGSGVIVATAFIHLLSPASDSLGNECLGGTFENYPWAFAICLMSLFLLFFTEIVTHYFIAKGSEGHSHSHSKSHSDFPDDASKKMSLNGSSDDEDYIDETGYKKEHDNKNQFVYDIESNQIELSSAVLTDSCENYTTDPNHVVAPLQSVPGKNHYSHSVNHQDPSQLGTTVEEQDKEKYLTQILGITILEIGVIFHSVFVGLSLAVSGDEFETLFIVLIFHQMFEGLGLGTRIAETNWPKSKRWTPWMMALGFTLTTPIAIAIGIGVRHSWIPGSRKSLIANGVFDSISAGILIYTGLVELMAHEFLFSNQFTGPDGFKRMLYAYVIMCCGAALMAVLGRWA